MILVVVVRRAVCEICGGSFDLEADELPPANCRHCGSTAWLNGLESYSQIRARLGETTREKHLNPGRKSLKRQLRAKGQYQHLKTKEQLEKEREQRDN